MEADVEVPGLAAPESFGSWVERVRGAKARLRGVRPGLSFRLLSLIISASLISVVASAYLLLRFQQQQLLHAAQSATSAVSNTIEANLHHAMLTNDRAMLNALIQAVAAEPDVEAVRILNAQGIVRVSSTAAETGALFERTQPACQACHGAGKVPAGNRAALFVSDAGRQTLLNVKLIRNRPECRGCHGAQHDILGLLMVEAPLGHLQEQLTSGLRYTLLLAAATFLFLVGAIVPVLRRSILKPIEELSQGVAEISGGNLDYRVPVAGPDELAMLAERFDAMRCALKASYTDMQRRNQELALLNEVAVASSQLLDVQEILDFTLDTVVNRLQMQAGAIYLLDQEAERTSRRACACAFDPECQGAAASDAGGSSRLRAPQCQALGCQGHWPALDLTAPADPASDPLFLANADAGRRAGAWWDERRGHAYVNVPLRCKGKVVGTMALITHSGQSLKRRDLDVLRAVGHEIGIAVNNAQLYRQVRHLAVLEERDRLAREMHDNLAQALGYLNLKASLTQELVAGGDISQAEASLAELKDVAKETYTDVREAIFSLRTPAAASAGLVATLEEYLTEYRAHYGIDARLQTDGAPTGQFGPEVTLQLLRVIQEALSNVRKHAAARRAWVRFEQRAEALSVTIADDGCGFDPRDASATGRGHFGLDIMRERTEIAGGSLNVYSQPGRGTRVVIEMPRDYDARD